MPFAEHTFAGLSKMFGDTTGTKIRWNPKMACPDYDVTMVDELMGRIRAARTV